MWNYNACLIRVIDGDTVVLKLEREFVFSVDFGFYIKEEIKSIKSIELSFRLLGINTPEITGVTTEERTKGLAAKAELERLLGLGKISATTYKPDKYGRWLVSLEVTLIDGSKIDVNQSLIANGFAVPYMV